MNESVLAASPEFSSVSVLEGLSTSMLLFVSSVASDSVSDSVSASGSGSALASCAVGLGRVVSVSSWMF